MTGSRAICISSFPLFSFIFFFLSLFLFFLFSRKRNCYAQSAIRLFHRCYPEDRNADVPVFSTLWIKFALHLIFFLFSFFVEFRFVFSIETNEFFPSFSSVAFYVALFLFYPCENFAINFRRFCTDFEFRWINKFEIDRSGFVLSKFFVR